MDNIALKKELRKTMLEARAQLSAKEVEQASKQIFERWCNRFSLKKVSYLHVFQSIRSKNEVDTSFYTDFLRRKHPQVKLVIPVVNKIAGELKHAIVDEDIELVPNRWGIPEPKAAVKYLYPMEMDMVLVPLLAFDDEGNRLGYGAGYYDKFLQFTRPNCLKIGLCFDLGRQSQLLPAEPHDVKLDFVVTESTILRFNPNLAI